MVLPVPSVCGGKLRILFDTEIKNSGSEYKGIRASGHRWSWWGRSIEYRATDGKIYYLNKSSTLKYLKRHHVENTSRLNDIQIVQLLDTLKDIHMRACSLMEFHLLKTELQPKSMKELTTLAKEREIDIGGGSMSYDKEINSFILKSHHRHSELHLHVSKEGTITDIEKLKEDHPLYGLEDDVLSLLNEFGLNAHFFDHFFKYLNRSHRLHGSALTHDQVLQVHESIKNMRSCPPEQKAVVFFALKPKHINCFKEEVKSAGDAGLNIGASLVTYDSLTGNLEFKLHDTEDALHVYVRPEEYILEMDHQDEEKDILALLGRFGLTQELLKHYHPAVGKPNADTTSQA